MTSLSCWIGLRLLVVGEVEEEDLLQPGLSLRLPFRKHSKNSSAFTWSLRRFPSNFWSSNTSRGRPKTDRPLRCKGSQENVSVELKSPYDEVAKRWQPQNGARIETDLELLRKRGCLKSGIL